MNKERPINLDLTKFHFPPMAIVSIIHRITGVLLFLFIPIFLSLLDVSLTSADGFHRINMVLQNGWMKFLMWLVLCSIFYHIVAGIRHLIMDFGVGESVGQGRASAYAVFGLAIILFILAGVWLW